MHTPLLTAEVPGSTPGAGAIFQRSTSGIDEETVSKTAAPPIGVQSAILWCSANFTLRSSTAEQPPDKRQTVERHHAEGPFHLSLDGSDR